MTKTVRVRVCVVVNAKGHWNSGGWFSADLLGAPNQDQEFQRTVMDGLDEVADPEKTYFLEADLPIPSFKEITVESKVDPPEKWCDERGCHGKMERVWADTKELDGAGAHKGHRLRAREEVWICSERGSYHLLKSSVPMGRVEDSEGDDPSEEFWCNTCESGFDEPPEAFDAVAAGLKPCCSSCGESRAIWRVADSKWLGGGQRRRTSK